MKRVAVLIVHIMIVSTIHWVFSSNSTLSLINLPTLNGVN
jgi:hypothetical protein